MLWKEKFYNSYDVKVVMFTLFFNFWNCHWQWATSSTLRDHSCFLFVSFHSFHHRWIMRYIEILYYLTYLPSRKAKQQFTYFILFLKFAINVYIVPRLFVFLKGIFSLGPFSWSMRGGDQERRQRSSFAHEWKKTAISKQEKMMMVAMTLCLFSKNGSFNS